MRKNIKEFATQFQNTTASILILNTQACYYKKLSYLEQALKCLEEALKIVPTSPQMVSMTLLNMAGVYSAQKEYPSQ